MNIAAVTSSRLYSRVRIGGRKGNRRRGKEGRAGGRAGGFLGVGVPGEISGALLQSLLALVWLPLPLSPFSLTAKFIIFQSGAPSSASGAEERSSKSASSKLVRPNEHAPSASSSMLYSASFDRLRPKSTRKRRRSHGGGGGAGKEGEAAAEAGAAAAWEPFLKNSRQQPLPSSSSPSSSQTSSGNAMKGFKKEYCRLKTLVPALSDREDLSKASAGRQRPITSVEQSKVRFA